MEKTQSLSHVSEALLLSCIMYLFFWYRTVENTQLLASRVLNHSEGKSFIVT